MSTRIITVTVAGRTTTVSSTDPARVLNVGPRGPQGAGGVTSQQLATAVDGLVATTDSRLSDARTPTAHQHASADVNGLDAALTARPTTSAVTSAITTATAGLVATSDSRLSDARTPLAHQHPTSDVTGLDTALAGKAATSYVDAGDAAVATSAATALTTGLAGKADAIATTSALAQKADATATTTALAGKVGTGDSRLTDARTPTAHASTHGSGGSDPITPAAIGAATTSALTTGLAGKADTTDSRLTDTRTPTDGSVTSAKLSTGVAADLATGVARTPASRLVSAGTGLTGGGDLTADRTLAVAYGTTAGTAAQGNDGRLAAPRPITAQSGQWQLPSNYVSSGAAGVTSGLVTFVPFDVGPVAKTFTQIGVGVAVAQVGGTTVTTVGVYPDNGTGGAPDCSAGPTVSATLDLTVTGNRTSTFGTALTLQPGRYWEAFIYVASVTPTTVATVNSLSNALGMIDTTAVTIGTSWRGWSVASQTALPTTQPALAQVGGSNAVIVALKVQ